MNNLRTIFVILAFIVLEIANYASHDVSNTVLSKNTPSALTGSLVTDTISDKALLRLSNKADTLVSQKQYQNAIAIYNEIASAYLIKGLGLECIKTWQQIAELYTLISTYDSAHFYLNKAIDAVHSIVNKTNTEKEVLQKCYKLAGELYRDEKNYKKSRDYYALSLSFIKELKGTENLEYSSELDNYAINCANTGREDTAIVLLKTSMAIKNKLLTSDDPRIGESYYIIATQFYFTDKFDSSLVYLFKSLEKTPSTNLLLVSKLNSNIGLIYQITARYSQATEFLEKALETNISLNGPNHLKVSRSYDALATNYFTLGDYEKAMLYYNKAIEIERSLCNSNDYSCYNPSLYNHLESFYFELGDLSKALEYGRIALKVSIKKYGISSSNLKINYFSLGNTMLALHLNDSALFYYHKALSVPFASNNFEDAIYQKISLAYSFLGDMQKAYDNLEQAIQIARKVYGDTNIHVTYLYLTYAEYLIKDRKPEKAYDYLTKVDSIRILNFGDSYSPDYGSYIGYADIHYLLGNYSEAEKNYLKAIGRLKSQFNYSLTAYESLRIKTRINADIYASLFKTEYHQNNCDKALSWLDITKSNELIARTYEKVFLENLNDTTLQKSLNHIKDSINYYSRKTNNPQENKDLLMLPVYNTAINYFNKEYDSLKNYVAHNYQEYNAIIRSTDPDREIDLTIESDDVFIYYLVSRDSVWITLAGKGSVEIYKTPCINHIDKVINNYNNLMQAMVSHEDIIQISLDECIQYFTKSQLRKLLGPVNYSKFILQTPWIIGKEEMLSLCDSINTLLYQLFIFPIEKQIESYKNLIIVPDNILSFMPFSSLYKKYEDQKYYLVENHDIRFTQSARLYGITKKRAKDYNLLKRKDLFALGISDFSQNSDASQFTDCLADNNQEINQKQVEYLIKRSGQFDGNFSDLPFTIREVDNIAGVFNKNYRTVVKNNNAVEQYIWQLNKNNEFVNYKMLHFATHAVYNNTKIDNTCMVLYDHDSAGPGNNTEYDGYLSIPEIMRLKLKADLVVLSACETAQGEVIPGEGVYGMPYAFLLAGANNVISSLWQVNDKTSEAFFTEFYYRIQNGESYVEALNNIYRLFILRQKGQANSIKIYSDAMTEILNNPQYLNPSFWSAYIIW